MDSEKRFPSGTSALRPWRSLAVKFCELATTPSRRSHWRRGIRHFSPKSDASIRRMGQFIRQLLWFFLPASTAAWAQNADQSSPTPNSLRRDENGEMLQRSSAVFTGALTYNSDVIADVDGGVSRGAAYLQRVGLIGDVDLSGLIGWHGASGHISVHLINGTGLTGRRVGNVLAVSGLEAEPAARLFNLWVEQKLGPKVTLRAGQFTAGQEFAISPTAALFVNSTFGWPASFATDLISGGPAYPLAAPGVRLAAMPREGFALRFAVFAGDPAGPGSADPQRRDLNGFNGFRLAGRPFFIGEISRSLKGSDPTWIMTLGGWVHSGDFADLELDDRYGPLASASSSGTPLQHRGNWSVYAIADGRLWRSGPLALRGFMRVAAGPADRNSLDLYLDGGLALAAPLRGRENDIVGIAFAIGRISPKLRSQAKDRLLLQDIDLRIPTAELVVEASWQFKLSSRGYLQPNVQFVLNPAGALLAGVPDPTVPSHAVVVGLRTSFRL